MGWKEKSKVGSYTAITLVAAIDKGLFLEAINCQQMSSLVISLAKRKKEKSDLASLYCIFPNNEVNAIMKHCVKLEKAKK